MKILVLNYEFPPIGGGASPLSYDISKQLASMGHQVDVVTMGFKGLPSFEHKDALNIYRVKSIRKKKEVCHFSEMLFFLAPAFFKSLQLQRKNNYDMCHCNFIIPTGVIALALKVFTRIPYIVSIHGTDMPDHNTDRFTFTSVSIEIPK